jgi:hypothetical protein
MPPPRKNQIDISAQPKMADSITDEDSADQPLGISIEQATLHSPEELVLLLPELHLCEAGQDALFDEYARVLGAETDRCFPLATNIRPHLLAAFDSIRELQVVTEGTGNHEGARLPGYVEHVLYSGFNHDFLCDTKVDCSMDEVDRVLSEMERQIDPRDGDDVESQLESINQARNRFLSALRGVESDLDEQGRQYFRSELLTYMRQWLRLSLEHR